MRRVALLALTAPLLACAHRGGGGATSPPSAPAAAAAPGDPAALLARAIERAGGAQPLDAARALRWDGAATVHAAGRRVAIRGSWALQPPDSAVVATYDTARGPATMRRLIVAGTSGWVEQGGTFTPMPADFLAAERDEFYLYHVMRLTPLRAPAVTLLPLPPDSLGQRGFMVARPGRPAVALYVDNSGRLTHLRLRITDARSGGQAWQDLWLAGEVESNGVRWPAQLRITMNGAPYFDLAIEHFRAEPRLVEPYLAGPR